MKRLHISFNVADLEKSVGFYSTLFASPPTIRKTDYAKWMLDDPRVNFVLEATDADNTGFGHAGIQAESDGELQDLFSAMQSAEAPYLEEGNTTCCYAASEKSWTSDPDGVMWEAFYTHHQTEERGTSGPAALSSGCGCC